MVDKNQLELLRGGVEQWNEWRRKHPRVEVDLNDVHISGVNLACTAYLCGADLGVLYFSSV